MYSSGGDFYGTEIDGSLRFNDDDGAYLNRTPASAGNAKNWTFSAWVKLGDLSQNMNIFGAGTVSTPGGDEIRLVYQSNKFRLNGDNTSGLNIIPSALHRDPSAWYHVVVYWDTANATPANRVKLYINGEQVTDFNTATYPSQNKEYAINQAKQHKIGQRPRDTSEHFDGYLAEVNFIDGQALTADSFGETKSGVWISKAYSGSYGTNGFHLEFAGNANDSSGNGNNWTANNIAASDYVLDSPTNNFATLNPISRDSQSGPSYGTLSEGNLKASFSDYDIYKYAWATQPTSTTGTYYWEVTYSGTSATTQNERWYAGASGVDNSTYSTRYYEGFFLYAHPAGIGNRLYYNGDSNYVTLGGTKWPQNNDVTQFLYDANTGKIWVGVNNSWWDPTGTKGSFNAASPTATLSTTGLSVIPYVGQQNYAITSSLSYIVNFGQQDFAYTPPVDSLTLSTANLPDPAIDPAEDDSPQDHFSALAYDGTGVNPTTHTGVGFQPDFVWLKVRAYADNHNLFDAVRGAGERISSNTSEAETFTTHFTAFNTDGFTTTADSGYNSSGRTYIAWNWKGNGSGSTNTTGSINSTVSANQAAGFSIVKYSGTNNASESVGHGLTQKPQAILLKKITSSTDWVVYHESVCTDDRHFLYLNTNAALTTGGATRWDISAFNTNTFTVGDDQSVNASGEDYIAYCFHSVEGFSKFGSYTGNGSSDGPFVYTGFRPAFLITKKTNGTGNWRINDSSRDPFNVVDLGLNANETQTEFSQNSADFLSNGFKIRDTGGANDSGDTYVYIAFAENPFKYANAR